MREPPYQSQVSGRRGRGLGVGPNFSVRREFQRQHASHRHPHCVCRPRVPCLNAGAHCIHRMRTHAAYPHACDTRCPGAQRNYSTNTVACRARGCSPARGKRRHRRQCCNVAKPLQITSTMSISNYLFYCVQGDSPCTGRLPLYREALPVQGESACTGRPPLYREALPAQGESACTGRFSLH